MSLESLKHLAESHGIETFYHEDNGRYCEASPESLLAILRVLGSDVARVEDAGRALRVRRLQLWQRPLEPVQVVWDGQGGETSLRLPAAEVAGSLSCRLEFENGESRFWTVGLAELPVREHAGLDGHSFSRFGLTLPPMPLGYHRLVLQWAGRTAEELILAAPTRAYVPEGAHAKTWGLFLPVYAVAAPATGARAISPTSKS